MRGFGLNEGYATIKQYVMDEVPQIAGPDIPWSLKDIVRIQSVGDANPNNPDTNITHKIHALGPQNGII